ncbi:hypothetical protein NDU88_010066 [Pleurodeles waltl]|uniref:Uncharacterized protein n=1 Tax=Pleurodeles waltl TaxID=8319 RepID=A0AAV7PYZ5_PLEWA|nr:hypothetical protein NDU88_010066 [Pleurodeles waltl]
MSTRTQLRLVLPLPLTARKQPAEPAFPLAPRSVHGKDGQKKGWLHHLKRRRSGGESRKRRPAIGLHRDGATTEEQKEETPGIHVNRSQHPHSPDPGTKTAGPGEPTHEPATLQEKRGQPGTGFDTGEGTGGGRRKGTTGTGHNEHGRVEKQGRKGVEKLKDKTQGDHKPNIRKGEKREKKQTRRKEKRTNIKKQTNSRH